MNPYNELLEQVTARLDQIQNELVQSRNDRLNYWEELAEGTRNKIKDCNKSIKAAKKIYRSDPEFSRKQRKFYEELRSCYKKQLRQETVYIAELRQITRGGVA